MHKKILNLAIPNILSNLTVPLLGMVDLHLMGYLESDSYIGAIGLGGVIFNFVYWGFGFLRMSISGLAAQAVGKGDQRGQSVLLLQALLVALIGGVILLLFQMPIIQFGLKWIDGSVELKGLVQSYFYTRIWAAPAAIIMMVFNGWFLGMQNSIFPMITSIFINLVNIASSYYFVHFKGMDVEGVALGSVIAQYSGVLLSIILFSGKYKYVLNYIRDKSLLALSSYRKFAQVSSDIFIRNCCVVSVFTFFTFNSTNIGEAQLNANTVLLQFLFLFSYFLDGFAYAAEALAGKFFGAKQRSKLVEVINKLFVWGLIFALIFSVLYIFFGKNMLSIFTDHNDVIAEASKYLPWLMFMPLVSFASYIWDGVYIGCTASSTMRNTMLISVIVFFFLPYYIFAGMMGNNAMWLAMLLFMASRGVLLTLSYKKSVLAKIS